MMTLDCNQDAKAGFSASDCSGARSNFKTIVADPPWPYEQDDVQGSRQPKVNGELDSGVSSVRRYGAMSIADLCAMPVKAAAAKDAHLYLWTTNSFMVEAHEIARAWGFEPKTILTWVKVRQEDGKPSMKTGYYYRGATEHCLFCVRGSLRLQGEAHPTVFLTPRPQRGHSAKPDYFYAMVEKQSVGPRLEIFARPQDPLWPKRDGWETWGNELPNDVELVLPNERLTAEADKVRTGIHGLRQRANDCYARHQSAAEVCRTNGDVRGAETYGRLCTAQHAMVRAMDDVLALMDEVSKEV